MPALRSLLHTFEQDIARLIGEGTVDRNEGLALADSPTNLMWRLQNDFFKPTKFALPELTAEDEPEFSDFTLDFNPG